MAHKIVDQSAEPDPVDDPIQTATDRKPRRSWRRKALLRAVEFGFILIVGPVLFVAIALWAATDNQIRLPGGVEARIEAALDETMPTMSLNLTSASIALPQGRGIRPEIVLTGVEVREQGDLRAFFPEISIALDGTRFLGGDLRPKRIRLDQAGMRLSRNNAGEIDIALSSDGAAEDALLTDTLARLDAMFSTPAFEELEEITGSGLVLLVADALTGQIIQTHDGVLLVRRDGADLTLTAQGSVDASRDAEILFEVTRNRDTQLTTMQFAFAGLATRDIATASDALGWLDLLRAPITGRLVAEISDAGAIGDLEGWLTLGAGSITPQDGVDPVDFSELRAEFRYISEARLMEFSELRLASAPVSFEATGQVQIGEGGEEFVGQLQLANVQADPLGLFSGPLEFDGGAFDMRLVAGAEPVLTIGQAVLHNGPLRVQLSGEAVAAATGAFFAFDARIPEIDAAGLIPYWPTDLIPGTRDWIDRNVTQGQITDLVASYRTGPNGGPPITAVRFDFEDLTMRPIRQMPPIENGQGYVSTMGSRFVMHLTQGVADAGALGVADLSGSTMVIPDTGPREPPAEIDLSVRGPVPAIGALLANPPVNLLAESPLDPVTMATGQVEGRVTLALPLRRRTPREEITFDARGVLRDVRTETLVPGRVLTSEALDLWVTPELVALAGPAEIDGIGLTGRWTRGLSPEITGGGRAEGRISLDADALRAFGFDLPAGTLTGAGGADFSLDLPAGADPRLRLSSEMRGLGLALTPLAWRLSEEATASLTAELILGDPVDIPLVQFDAPGLEMLGSVSLDSGGGFDRLAVSTLRVGRWLDVTGAVVGRGDQVPPAIEMGGGRLDLTSMPPIPQGGGGDGPPILGRLDRVQVTEGITLTDVAADFGPGLFGDFRGLVNGQASIGGQLVPAESGRAIRVVAEDAGRVLGASGIFSNAFGGTLDLLLRPTGNRGEWLGTLDITGARLRNAPAMAELLSAVSVVGLLEQLTGEGINLGDVDARFLIQPRAVRLTEGTAIGPPIGISMDGLYDLQTGNYDMQGVISPFYLINGPVGVLFAPRREGLFGFNYRLTGGPGRQNVTVNPLSILTPGIFREIFRAPPPRLEEDVPSQ